ncbi:MAG: NADH-quinone oxidoreductase subunit C [Promethearchaeota archaeon]
MSTSKVTRTTQLDKNNILEEIEAILGSDFIKLTTNTSQNIPIVRYNRKKTQNLLDGVKKYGYRLDGIIGIDLNKDIEINYILSNPEYIANSEIILQVHIEKKLEQPSISDIFPNSKLLENNITNRLGLVFSTHDIATELLVQKLCQPIKLTSKILNKKFPKIGIFDSIHEKNTSISFCTNRINDKIDKVELTTGWYYSRTQPKLESLENVLDASNLFQNQYKNEAFSLNLAYILNLEKSLGITITNKVNNIRTLLSELDRIRSHLIWFVNLALILNRTTFANKIQGFIKKIERKNKSTFNHPILFDTILLGSVADISQSKAKNYFDFLEKISVLISKTLKKFMGSSRIRNNLTGIGKIPKQRAYEIGLSGPSLRASGNFVDARKSNPYLSYNLGPILQKWSLIGGINGDCYSRTTIRKYEIIESMSIASEMLKGLSNYVLPTSKPISYDEDHEFDPFTFTKIESPQGSLSITFLTGNERKSKIIHSIRILTPDLRNFAALSSILIGEEIQNVSLILHTLDIRFPMLDL